MNCNNFKDSLFERFGDIILTDIEKEHLKSCPECRSLYEEMTALDDNLSILSFEPATPIEYAAMNQKLDRRIDKFVNRAFGWYRFGVRYGVALSAFLLIMVVSMIPNLYTVSDNYDYPITSQYSYYDTSYDTETNYEDSTLSDTYINLVIENYSADKGYNSGDQLIGELDEDEYEYLMENFDAGDIL